MLSKTMEKQIIIYLLFGGVIKSISGQTPLLQIIDSDPEGGVEEGSDFTLNCTVTISDSIRFKLNDTGQALCNAPFGGFLGSCIPNTITQSFATTITSWTISPATTAHNGFWKCSLGAVNSVSIMLAIYKFPSAVVTSSGILSDTIVNDTSSYPIVVQVDCMFSQNGPSMELQFVEGGTSRASVIMSCTTLSTACSPCTGCSAYSCRHIIILKQYLSSGQLANDIKYALKIRVGVTGTTQTFSEDVFAPHTIMFQTTSEVTTEGTTEGTLITSTPPSTESPPPKPNQCKIILFIDTSYPEHICEKWNAVSIGVVVVVVIVLIVVVCIWLKRNNSKENNCCPNTTGKDEQVELSNANGSK